MTLEIDVLTLFPAMLVGPLSGSPYTSWVSAGTEVVQVRRAENGPTATARRSVTLSVSPAAGTAVGLGGTPPTPNPAQFRLPASTSSITRLSAT